tara:strand:+ start:258 stop:1658 length:1401 start_codon:yes stop_codon:yes gene_type:complete
MPFNFAAKSPVSLSTRVISLISISLLLSFFLFGVVIERLIQHHFAQQDSVELSVIAQSVNSILQAMPADADVTQLQSSLKQAVVGHHGVYFAVYSDTNDALYQSPEADLSPLLRSTPHSSLHPDMLVSWQTPNHHYRGAVMLSQMSNGKSAILLVANNMDFHMQFIANFRKTLWFIMPVAWLLTLGSAWLAIKLGHRPLQKVSRDIRNISAEKLHLRLEPQRVPAELQELVTSFNSMISQIELGYKRLSHFSADIAHELRTPLTNLATQTQVVLSQKRNVNEYTEILYSNHEEYERLTKMVSDMLWLAKTDNGLIVPSLTHVDLRQEIQALFEYFEAWAEEAQLSFELAGEASMQVDRDMLRRALSNLLSNTIKYSYAQTAVSVSLLLHEDVVSISIENNGETIPPQHLCHLFDRFYRADPSRYRNGDSSGLGLAIVKSIIDIHHGSIDVSSSNNQTIFMIKFPKK